MRIISWNCNGGLARKLPLVTALHPDLLVIQEASQKHIDAIDAPFTHWVGKGHRGLALIGYSNHEFRIDSSWDTQLPWFTPLHFGDLHVLAVWASVLTSSRRYVRLLHEALDLYSEFLDHPNAMVIGDLNSNAVFDRKHSGLDHTSLVSRLRDLDYTSLWHHQQGEVHGGESQPTFYLYRRSDRTWQLDFAFLTTSLLERATIQIGDPDTWLDYSDHLPLIVDF